MGERLPENERARTTAGPDGELRVAPRRAVSRWLELTAVMNEMSRSMGQQDFYPFVLSAPAVAKLHLVHRIVAASGERGTQGRPRRRQAAPPASSTPDSSIAQA